MYKKKLNNQIRYRIKCRRKMYNLNNRVENTLFTQLKIFNNCIKLKEFRLAVSDIISKYILSGCYIYLKKNKNLRQLNNSQYQIVEKYLDMLDEAVLIEYLKIKLNLENLHCEG